MIALRVFYGASALEKTQSLLRRLRASSAATIPAKDETFEGQVMKHVPVRHDI
jgi:hypothetical protein